MLFGIAGFCAAAVGVVVWGPKRSRPVEDLANRLEDGWKKDAYRQSEQ